MKIVFLDFDGVLNCITSPEFTIERVFVERLNRILAVTGAHVVISSSWRLEPREAVGALLMNGFAGGILGGTPYLPGAIRGLEIQTWINAQGTEPESFCILDDDQDMGHLTPFLIKTSLADGLQDRHVERAIEILMSPGV